MQPMEGHSPVPTGAPRLPTDPGLHVKVWMWLDNADVYFLTWVLGRFVYFIDICLSINYSHGFPLSPCSRVDSENREAARWTRTVGRALRRGRNDQHSGHCGHSSVTGRKRLRGWGGCELGDWPDTLRELTWHSLNIFLSER